MAIPAPASVTDVDSIPALHNAWSSPRDTIRSCAVTRQRICGWFTAEDAEGRFFQRSGLLLSLAEHRAARHASASMQSSVTLFMFFV